MAHTAAITALFLLYKNTNRFIVIFFFIASSLLHWLRLLTRSWEKDSQATFISFISDSAARERGVGEGVGDEKKKNGHHIGWKKKT